ncbi:MAG: tetratricopeptide repeat protein [Candidatus Krumholzibacteriia bacterium]
MTAMHEAGMIANMAGEPAQAESVYVACRALLEAAGRERTRDDATVLSSLGWTVHGLGDAERAEDLVRRGSIGDVSGHSVPSGAGTWLDR